MSEKALLIAREDIIRVIRENNSEISYEVAIELADQLVKTIDWQNPALMHKGIEWITMFYLKQMIHA